MTSEFFSPLNLTVATGIARALPAVEADGGATFLEILPLNASHHQYLVVCHRFGCAYRNQFVVTPAKVATLRDLLGSPRPAKHERKALAKAAAWFDREGSRAAGTVGRIGRAGVGTKSGPTQMDCIDLTVNVNKLLIVLQQRPVPTLLFPLL